MKLCFAISTIGRESALECLLQSLARQDRRDFVVGVCDQSRGGGVRAVVDRYQDDLEIFVVTSTPGLSAGRNSVIRAAPPSVTHFLFPNDTSVFGASFCEELTCKHASADIAVMNYVSDGKSRYEHPRDGSWTASTVWSAIEAATMISRRLLDEVGGFDEGLGSGSAGPWQSGEGTDLLLRTLAARPVVHWDAELCISGVGQENGLSRKESTRKLRAYGRGKGYVLRRWSYPVHHRVGTVVKPWIDLARGRSTLGLDGTISTSWGRLEGLMGRCTGRRRSDQQAPVLVEAP